MVTVAVADCNVSICAAALTVTVAGDGTIAGAVYNPPAVTVPHADPVQPVPLTLQLSAVFVLPVTVARNCCWPPTATCALVGVTLTATGAMTVTVAVDDFVPSASDVAVTVTFAGAGIFPGAVYSPLTLIVPHAIPVHPAPVTLHVTPVFSVPVTLAANCWVSPVT